MLKKTFITITTAFLLLTFFFVAQPQISAQSKKDKNKAEKLVEEGNRFSRKNDYKSAIEKYAEAITLYPGYAEAHFWKGSAHYRLNENDQAINDLDIALQQGYSPLPVYKARWFLYYQKENYDAALKDAQEGLKLESDTTFFPLAIGDIYRSKKEYENALASYEKVAPRETKNADLPYYMAVSYQGLGRYDKQRAAANEAIKKGTKFPGEAWYILGDSFFKEKKYTEASEPFERSLTANDKYYDAYAALAESYRFQGNFKKAISTLERGLKVFENDGQFLIDLTWYHSLAGNNGEAIREGQKAVKAAKDNARAFTNLCRAYSDSTLHKQALENCKEALKIDPKDGAAHFYAARALESLRETEKATAEFKLAVQGLEPLYGQNSDNADGIYLLGNAYLANGQYDNAIETYKRALNLVPLFKSAHYNLAYTYKQKGNKEAAMSQYEKLKDIDPKLAERLLKVLEEK